MFCVSLHFQSAGLDARESFPYDEHILAGLEQGVFLSTCNRLEVYGVGDVYSFVNTWFADYKTQIFLYEDKLAIRHLYRVAAGLDSMVLGEDEILGQVKQAYAAAKEAGRTGYELNTIFQGAITAAKKVKTDTLLSKSSVSTATLAASACAKYWNEQGTDGTAKVLVIGGSGDIGRKVLKDLTSYPQFSVSATVREHGIRDKVQLVDYRDRYEAMKAADIVVSATRHPKFTVTREQLLAVDGGALKPRFYVDLAVPRDIDPVLSPVLTMKDIEELARENNKQKQNAAVVAESILNEELETLYKDLTFHRLRAWEGFAAAFGTEDRKHFLYAFRDRASSEEFDSFVRVLLRDEGEHQ